MISNIKSEAKSLVRGIEISLFFPMFVVFMVNAGLTSTIIGSIFSMALTYVADLYIYKYVCTGRRMFSCLYEDFNNLDNLIMLFRVGLRLYLYMLPASLAVFIISLITMFTGVDAVIWLIIIAVVSILASVAMIVLKLIYYFVGYIAKDAGYNMSTGEVFELSKRMTNGNIWFIVKFNLSFIGHFLLVIVTFGIYSIWFSPYYSTAKSIMYQKVRDEYLNLHQDILADKIRPIVPKEPIIDGGNDDFDNVTDIFGSDEFKEHDDDPFA